MNLDSVRKLIKVPTQAILIACTQSQVSNQVIHILRICMIVLPSSIVTQLNVSDQVIRLVRICLILLQLPIISQFKVLNQVIRQMRICLIHLLWYIQLTTSLNFYTTFHSCFSFYQFFPSMFFILSGIFLPLIYSHTKMFSFVFVKTRGCVIFIF